MTKHQKVVAYLVCGLLTAGYLSSVSAASQAKDETDEIPLNMNNPGSIVERLKEDAEPEDNLVEFPDDSVMKPWYDFKADLSENHGFNFGISYTTYYQKATDTFGPEDDATSFDLDISGNWTFLGRGTDSPTMLGFGTFWRDKLGSGGITPQTLFTQFGGLYSTAAPYGEEDPVLGELWIQKKFKNVFGFRVGKIFPITAYDFFPFKNFRTDFVDFNHVTNTTIPLPGNGLGAFVVYRPQPKILLRLGIHDANANVQKSGFDTYDGELFTIFEVGYDIGLMPRSPGRPPHGHIHASLWHQDERTDAGIKDGQGIGLSAVQRFGRFSPFVRYGYADVEIGGPSSVKHMANAGLVIDRIFGQDKDRVGLGYTWSEPVDTTLDNQGVIDAYYRVHLTREFEIGPTLEVIFDPVHNPTEDKVFVWGFRARIAL